MAYVFVFLLGLLVGGVLGLVQVRRSRALLTAADLLHGATTAHRLAAEEALREAAELTSRYAAFIAELN